MILTLTSIASFIAGVFLMGLVKSGTIADEFDLLDSNERLSAALDAKNARLERIVEAASKPGANGTTKLIARIAMGDAA